MVRVVEISAGADSVLARTDGHQAYAWGHGGFGQNGMGSPMTCPPPRAPPRRGDGDHHPGRRYHSFATVDRS